LSMPPGSFIGPCEWKNGEKNPWQNLFSQGHNLIYVMFFGTLFVCNLIIWDFFGLFLCAIWLYVIFLGLCLCAIESLEVWWPLWQFFNNDSLSNRWLLSSNDVFH
jgi:hypothetical protein